LVTFNEVMQDGAALRQIKARYRSLAALMG
jgi:hypothetical protein